jgi:protein ImuB
MYCCLVSGSAPPGVLVAIARACSPRVAPHDDRVVVFDVSGLTRVLGPPDTIAREVTRMAREQGVLVQVAIARTTTAAWLLAHACPGPPTLVPVGDEAQAVSRLPIRWLMVLPDVTLDGSPAPRRRARGRHFRLAPGPGRRPAGADPTTDPTLVGVLAIFDRWGLTTLGDIAKLPRADLHARMGSLGVRVHQAACGEDARPLTPAGEAARFVDRLELEWPIDGLEPLSFVLARQCDALALTLERADRGAVTVTTRLRLVTKETHERVLHLPAPMRDSRVLRTLILLDLESHPAPAAIDEVEIELGVTPARIVCGSLLARALPSPEDLVTLVARLGALMGESRIGAPALVDTHDPRAVAIKPFVIGATPAVSAPSSSAAPASASVAVDPAPSLPHVRRFRLPLAATVTLDHGAPVHLHIAVRGLCGGRIVERAGPWRTSGAWWTFDRAGWDREEWDVAVATGEVYRLAKVRGTGQWEVEGVVD